MLAMLIEEPIEATEAKDPTLPMLNTDPALAMLSSESLLAMLHREPEGPREAAAMRRMSPL
ncbi:hypothetical protein GCM10022215_16980 [Nocardioides fonticola]|uniref:Uncharacterized protein n=1 Tax=Nocardioides fonticola TaxID=450363 RepID=A0ABP7XHP3_9ACTN